MKTTPRLPESGRWLRLGPLLVALGAILTVRVPAGADDPLGLVAWGDTVTVARAGWGRMICLADGRWLGVSTLYPSARTNVLQLRVSGEGARTWRALSTITEPGRKLDNGELIQLPNGTILISGRSVVDRVSYHLPVYRSTDGGEHWMLLSQIDTNDRVVHGAPAGQGLWEPHFFLLGDGALAAAYANEKHSVDAEPYSQVCSERVSRDGGTTWGPEIIVASQPGGGALRPGMPVVTRLSDGRYFEVSEIVGIGNADVYGKLSPDGMRWPGGLGTPIPAQHAGPWVTALADGCLLATSCSNQISVSEDNGATWRLTAPPAYDYGQTFSFPAIYEIAPGQIAVMNTHRGVTLRFGAMPPQLVPR